MTISILLIVGAALLVVGAELLVRGATLIAAAAGIRPLVIGLTVVAFGTSAPELAVSLGATFAGEPGIAVGNVVGSNIFNVLFILGVSALFIPLIVEKQVVRFELPIMLAVSVLLLLLSFDGRVGRLDGMLLFGGLIGYLIYLGRTGGVPVPAVEGPAPAARTGDVAATGAGIVDPVDAAPRRGPRRILIAALLALLGLVLLIAGSRFFVEGAVALATLLGVSQTIIGLTIIAAGTSLPELATSVLAGIRGERDIAVGNVVGSNIFNILAILGLCGLLAPAGVEVDASILRFDLPVMIAVAVFTLPVFFTGYRIARPEGLLFLAFYLAYTGFLILEATRHDTLDELSNAMLLFVIPLTVCRPREAGRPPFRSRAPLRPSRRGTRSRLDGRHAPCPRAPRSPPRAAGSARRPNP